MGVLMSYENAPATKMLATHCAACGRPLVDAVSVETGLGPDCRKKYSVEVSEENRELANGLVYQLALEQTGEAALRCAFELRALGFVALADRVADRCADITISVDGDVLLVATPWSESANEQWRTIRGRRWDRELRVNRVPSSERAALWALLRRCFGGRLATGPKGPFVVG
jgi:hypothetical protein